MFADDAVGGEQTHPGAVRLGGEMGFEQAAAGRVRDAWSVVADAEIDLASATVAGRDFNVPAVGHGVDGVQEKVARHLAQEHGISAHQHRRG